MNVLPGELSARLDSLTTQYELESWRDQIRSLARLSFLMPVEPSDDAIPIGASRIGGTPDAPDGFNWPAEEDGLLNFLAQINLGELPLALPGLPRSGWLRAFATQEESDDNPNVVFCDGGLVENLTRHTQPLEEDYADEFAGTLGILAVTEFVPAISLPSHFQWTADEDAFINEGHADRFNDMSRELLAYPTQKQPVSRLGGYPSDLEDADERDHHLVLRIESWFGSDFEINFWDAGVQQLVAKSLQPQGDRIPNTIAPVFSM